MTVQSAGRPIVVGVDDSAGAVEATRWAARYANETGAPLALVHAVATLATASVMLPVPLGVSSAGLRRPPPSGDEVLGAAVDEAVRHVPQERVHARTVTDPPVATLLEASKEAGLLVLGTRDRGRMATMLTGSVAGKVIAAAHCPVVVVRGEPDPAGPIVVAVDASEHSRAALHFAFREAARRGSALFAVHAWQPALVPVGTGAMAAAAAANAPTRDEVAAAARRSLADAVAPWRAAFPDVPVRERMLDGHPDNAVAEETAGAALVVAGSRGRGPVAGFLLGSTSQALLHHSTCPVVVVRQPDDDDRA